MTESTTVVPVWQAKARLALREGAKLTDVAKALVSGMDEQAEAEEAARLAELAKLGKTPTVLAAPFPAVPEAADLTPEQKTALVDLSKVFNVVTPDKRRALTDAESTALYRERETLRAILEPLGNRDELIKEYVRNHLDVTAEKDKVADPVETERDAHGHYIVAALGKPERARIPGTDQAWSREYRSGTVTISGGDLLDLYESGQITRETYLSFTREVRVFDEAKTTAAIVKDPSLLDVLKLITKRNGAGTSVTTRKAKAK